MNEILIALGIIVIYASMIAFMISTILLGVYAYVKGMSVDLGYVVDLTAVLLIGVLLYFVGLVV